MPFRVSAICGLLAPITFIAGWLLGGLAQPSAYSPFDHDISDLGALTADSPWLYNQIGSNITGVLVLALAMGLWKAVGTRLSARIGVIALGVVGVGQFLDGLFRLDCRERSTLGATRRTLRGTQTPMGSKRASRFSGRFLP